MELRHLRYFVAIAEEGSFTRAAERLWIAQPGLSSQIRHLEAELGVQLFNRHTRGADLTVAGALFLERAREVLAVAESARRTGHELEAGLVGSVCLGVATDVPWPGLPAFLHQFGRERPALELTVIESYEGRLLHELRKGRLDAIVAPEAFGSAELRKAHLGCARWLVLAGRGHRLAGRRSITVGELDGARIVVTGHRDGGGYDRLVGDTLAALGVTAVLEHGGPGPALLGSVAAGETLALTSTPNVAVGGITAVALSPVRRVPFALLWGAETPTPALGQLIRYAETRAGAPRRTLVVAA